MHEVTIARLPFIAPQNVAISAVQRNGVMIAGSIKNSSGRKRSRFGRHGLGKGRGPNLRELIHILQGYLGQRTITRSADIVIRVGPVAVIRTGRVHDRGGASPALEGPG